MMLSEMRVAIVGLGLMGGSLALALRGKVARVVGVDVNPAGLAYAFANNMIDFGTTDLAEGVREADVVVLATPVRAIVGLLAEVVVARPGGVAILDLGSTKGEICRAMAQLPSQFEAVGGHPMCGKEVGGVEQAEGDLYVGKTFVLSRPGIGDSGEWAVGSEASWAVDLVKAIGAEPLVLEAALHDRLVALSSHVPYLVAALLMKQAAALEASGERVWSVAAGGFRDTTRLAGSDPTMLRDIVLTNRPGILTHLHTYQQNLTDLIALLENADEAALTDWLNSRQTEHRLYRATKPNLTQLAARERLAKLQKTAIIGDLVSPVS